MTVQFLTAVKSSCKRRQIQASLFGTSQYCSLWPVFHRAQTHMREDLHKRRFLKTVQVGLGDSTEADKGNILWIPVLLGLAAYYIISAAELLSKSQLAMTNISKASLPCSTESGTASTDALPKSPVSNSVETVTSSFMKFVEKQHESLRNKWVLSTGTCVEDQILKFAKKCQFEK